MSTSIDQAFVKQFEREVHEAYQRQGSKLRGTVRVKTGVVGGDTVFQTVGTSAALAIRSCFPRSWSSVASLAGNCAIGPASSLWTMQGTHVACSRSRDSS